MKRYAALPEVMGSTEAAAEIGVRMQNLNSNAIRDLPEPDQIIAAGRIWRAEKIREFAVEYKDRQQARKEAAEAAQLDRTARNPEQPDEVAA